MSVQASGTRWYNTVWRWHFYAGLVCIPFVIWLALTGSIYLWRPQVEGWLDQRFDHLATTIPAQSPDAQVAAALRAVPGSALRKYVLPDAPDHAVRIIVTKAGTDSRVYVDPATLAVLQVVPEASRLFPLLSRLHGELLAGTVGSYVVEIAACWAVTMLLTGLYLWWPRGRRGTLGGVLYPRLGRGKRVFWRDLHATTGIWVSVFALGLILTGLPWAKGWGSYLVEIRQLTGTSNGPVEWTIGGKAAKLDPAAGEHAGMAGMTMAPASMKPAPAPPIPPGALTRVVSATRPLGIAGPVLIAPPKTPGAPWKITSDAADRPLRAEATIDGDGHVLSRSGFAERHWIDRLIGYGIAVHEGALLGLANQIAGTLTALALALLAGSGAVLWWRRRPIGLLGAPIPLTRPRFGPVLIAAVVALGLYMPLFGATLLLVLATEWLVLRRLAGPRRWLGLGLGRVRVVES